MGIETKVEYLIVDTSAFIKNTSLQDIGKNIITEVGVVNEIKSKRQLRRLVVLPYDLEVKEAFPEDIKFVTEFAKLTGDYKSLSATDIKVIALTYRYEKEKVGASHLRQEPLKKKEIVDSNIQGVGEHSKNLIGFYLPEHEEDNENDEGNSSDDMNNCQEYTDKNKEKSNVRANHTRSISECSSSFSEQDDSLITANDSSDEIETESYYSAAEEKKDDVNNLDIKFKKLNCDPEELEVNFGEGLSIDDILKPITNELNKEDEGTYESESEVESNSDDGKEIKNEDCIDDDGWITIKNFIKVKKLMDADIVKDKPATVACLTMDYAMQNVLMQIGLNIASLEGKVIKEMRTFILRCYACFKTTGIPTKVFCPHCGNKTLKKVAVSLDDEGKQQIHINFRKPLTSKGKKFSLPTFQGGKHACNPILFEDQPVPDQRPTKLGRAKNDPLNEDYVAGYSPFVMRDVNSRAAMLGIRSGTPMKYWMRRNPNEVRKHRK